MRCMACSVADRKAKAAHCACGARIESRHKSCRSCFAAKRAAEAAFPAKLCSCGAKIHGHNDQCRKCYDSQRSKRCACGEPIKGVNAQCRRCYDAQRSAAKAQAFVCPSCGGKKSRQAKRCVSCAAKETTDAIDGCSVVSSSALSLHCVCECGRTFKRPKHWVADVNCSWAKRGTRHVCAVCQRKKIRKANSTLFPKSLIQEKETAA